MTRRLVVLGFMVFSLAGGFAFAQTNAGQELDPLLELLVKKGVITQAEASALQAEADAEKVAPAAPARNSRTAAPRRCPIGMPWMTSRRA